MSISVKDSGVWKTATPHVRDSGVWKPVQKAWVRDAGVWKQFYSRGPSPGDYYPEHGGYYGGGFTISGVDYALIVAPKESGERAPDKFYTTNLSTPANSLFDGRSNTLGLSGAHLSARNWVVALTIGGFNDWYIPSMYELDALYFSLKPGLGGNNTSVGTNPYSIPVRTSNFTSDNPPRAGAAAFQEGGSQALAPDFYWTSTRITGSNTPIYGISMGDGYRGLARVDEHNWRTRAIRRINLSLLMG